MGDLRGRAHIAKQDLSKLQIHKMKRLRVMLDEYGDTDESESEDEEVSSRKRQKETDPDGFGVLFINCAWAVHDALRLKPT